MRPVLFTLPLSAIHGSLPDLPIYGYGLMLFLAYLFCTALARRLCKREGIEGTLIPDLAIWLFVAGIVGGRIVFVIQYWRADENHPGFENRPLLDVIKLWDGGLVLYGALIGGALGYFAYDFFILRKHNVSKWKMIDVIAPCIALGVALGRIGCLFTGCCYGNVACPPSAPVHFPLGSPAWGKMVKLGYQSPYGFLLKHGTNEVEGVDVGSKAEEAGLRRGDNIAQVNGAPVTPLNPVAPVDGEFRLDVLRDDGTQTVTFTPTSIGVHPTQIYETISMCLLLFFLLSYYPYKRRDGEVLVLLMLGYGVHRFLNEMLRTDTEPVAFGLTLSQNVSIAVLAAALVLAYVVWCRPPISALRPTPPTGGEALATQ